MLWMSLLIGVVAGAAWGGGLRSLVLARQGQLREAQGALRRSARVAGVCGALLTFPTLGWPFLNVSTTVAEEVTRTVVETVVVPVKVTTWFFWTVTRMESRDVAREISDTAYHTHTRKVFSVWMLALMAGVGYGCYQAEVWVVRLAWRWLA